MTRNAGMNLTNCTMAISKRLAWVVVALSAILPMSVGAAAPRYVNYVTVTVPPQIDAVEFVNEGIFDLVTDFFPFDTQNTRFYTNRGQMIGMPGFRFEFIDDNGVRRPATSFDNRGLIEGNESFLNAGQLEPLLQEGFTMGSYIEINATNVTHNGVMRVGPLGRLTIHGSDVRLERGGLVAGIAAFQDLGFPFTQRFGDFTYVNPGGLNEVYWGVGVNGRMDPQATDVIPLNPSNVSQPSSGFHEVAYPTERTNLVSIPSAFFRNIAGYSAYAQTNAVSETNWIVQVVFAPTNYPPGAGVDVRFGPANVVPALEGASSAMVEYSLPDVDAVTGLPFTNRVYIIDTHAAVTNAVLMTNALSTTLRRPDVIDFALDTPPEWTAGAPGNAEYTPDLLAPPDSPSVVTNFYAAVSVGLGTVSRVITTPGGSGLFPNLNRFLTQEDNAIFGGSGAGYLSDPTNNPARVEINADTLDLHLTRLKSDGPLTVRAKHYTGRSPSRTDSPVFRFDVGSTNGSVVVSNLVPTTVRRLSGVISCWSGIWTNQLPVVGPSPEDPAVTVTNTIEIRTHALIVDTSGLGSEQSVETMDAIFHSDHVEYHDTARITRSILIDAESFHNLGEISLLRPRMLSGTEFPRLLVLTNDGSFSAPDGFFLGTLRSISNRVQRIVNNGSILGGAVRLDSDELMNSGVITAPDGIIELTVKDVKFDGGSLASLSDVRITANDLKAQASFIQTGTVATNPTTGIVTWYPGTLVLDVASRLTDTNGEESQPNDWLAHDGFRLVTKPAEGDLLNTTLRSAANIYGNPLHLWAAEDRGPTAEGYANNVAIGRLVLDGRFQSLFTFAPVGESNALYVNFLELTGDATNVTQALDIRPGFRIYFIDSNLPAEELDGLFDGRLVHVAGVDVGPPPASGGNGDGDGDGEEDGVQLTFRAVSSPGGAPKATLSWVDDPGGLYSVEYTTDLVNGPWIPIRQVSNGASRKVLMDLPRDVAPESDRVFFRVVEVK
jgi:hypothetical protein